MMFSISDVDVDVEYGYLVTKIYQYCIYLNTISVLVIEYNLPCSSPLNCY